VCVYSVHQTNVRGFLGFVPHCSVEMLHVGFIAIIYFMTLLYGRK
jgi:hypothetical protein